MQEKRDGFSSQFGVIAAAAGSAIGLGNIWRFPYVLGENGGGAFLLVYLLLTVIIGLPLMLSELSIGRSAQRGVLGAFKVLTNNGNSRWKFIGAIGVAAALMILSFYSSVAGCTLEYFVQALSNNFTGKSQVEIGNMYSSFISGAYKPLFWLFVFLALNALIVVAGVKNGIEKYTKVLMPLLFVIIIILDIKAVTMDGAAEGLKFLFNPDFSKINQSTFLEALGQAFFSLSLGMGTLITYGSYIKRESSLPSTVGYVAFSDVLIAVLAGVAIFPAVFAFGIEPGSGPGLVFQTLPNIFAQMSGGYIFGVMFFGLLVIAALTSSVSLLEVVIAYCTEELKLSRRKATWGTTFIVSLLGILCVLSDSSLKDFTIFGHTVFGLFDYVSSNILLPIGGLSIAIFTGWALKPEIFKKEVVENSKWGEKLYPVIMFIIKVLAPIAIALVFLNGLGLLEL